MEKEGSSKGTIDLKRDLERSQEENERLREDLRRSKEQWEVIVPFPSPLVAQAITGVILTLSLRREHTSEGLACLLRVIPEDLSLQADLARVLSRLAAISQSVAASQTQRRRGLSQLHRRRFRRFPPVRSLRS